MIFIGAFFGLKRPAPQLPIFAGLILFCLSGVAEASPVFYLSEGTNANGDLTFQADTIGMNFVENDFDDFNNSTNISSITFEDVIVKCEPSATVFWGAYNAGGGQYGTVSGGALYSANSIKFLFSGDAVKGFGVWLFDDGSSSQDYFSITVEDYFGNSWTSDILDANPGSTNHIVEGFIGVISQEGIKNVTLNGTSGFEFDHMQIAATSVPLPGAIWLFGAGTVGLLGIFKNPKKNSN